MEFEADLARSREDGVAKLPGSLSDMEPNHECPGFDLALAQCINGGLNLRARETGKMKRDRKDGTKVDGHERERVCMTFTADIVREPSSGRNARLAT